MSEEIKHIAETDFVKRCSTDLRNNIDFFLGSGASQSSGIPVGQEVVWMLKRDLFCRETHCSKNDYLDINSHMKNEIQTYFNNKEGFPKCGDSTEYAFYFEKACPDQDSQDYFIKELMKNAKASVGYSYLGAILLSNFTKTVWTTNFDNLVNKGINRIEPDNDFVTYSIKLIPNIDVLRKEEFPCVCKLHGDFRYEHTKNTSEEVHKLDLQMESCFKTELCSKGLVVLGYSGSDNSIMSALESWLDKDDFLSKGIYWLKLYGAKLSPRVQKLLDVVKSKNKKAFIVDIRSFDLFFEGLYDQLGIYNPEIENYRKSTNLGKFSETIAQDLKDSNSEEFLEKGYIEFLVKPLVNKKIFHTNTEIDEIIKSVDENSYDILSAIKGKISYQGDILKRNFIENDGIHYVYIDKNSGYEIFSTFTDGLFILRQSYIPDRRFSYKLHISFVSIVEFVKKSLLFAKQFYDGRLNKDEKIDFELKLTKTKGRELTPPTLDSRMCSNSVDCSDEEIILKKVYEYKELNDYMKYSEKIVGEICKSFGISRGEYHANEWNEKSKRYF